MHNRMILSSEEMECIGKAALAHAAKAQWQVTVAIVDGGGHLQWLWRMDDASPASASIASAKARTAALGQRDTKFYEDMVNAGRPGFLSAPGLECILEGGVAIEVAGRCVGAVGVSGVRSTQDAEIARAGIAALKAAGECRQPQS